jgi:hypothetical protein
MYRTVSNTTRHTNARALDLLDIPRIDPYTDRAVHVSNHVKPSQLNMHPSLNISQPHLSIVMHAHQSNTFPIKPPLCLKQLTFLSFITHCDVFLSLLSHTPF